MSPTEDELRSALHDGAGDVPDVEHIVFAATERRVQRRRLTLAVASAVIVVGVLGAGGTYLVQRGSPAQSSGSEFAVNGAHAPAAPAAAGAAGAASGARGTMSSPSTICPSNVPRTALPGGGRRNIAVRLDRQAVHPAGGHRDGVRVSERGDAEQTHRVTLTGSDAKALAGSLENASKTPIRGLCSDLRSVEQKTLAIIANTASGQRLPTVTTTINEPACAVRVTNGTAVRYGWSVSLSLSPKLKALGGRDGRRPRSPPGRGSTVTVSPSRHIDESPAH